MIINRLTRGGADPWTAPDSTRELVLTSPETSGGLFEEPRPFAGGTGAGKPPRAQDEPAEGIAPHLMSWTTQLGGLQPGASDAIKADCEDA